MKACVAALAALVLAMPAARASGPVVVELFTSQGCASCPPADRKLAELKRTQPDLLPLDFHVDYWNGLGWKDPYSLPAATRRQWDYAHQFGLHDVYTPQLVAGGMRQAVGSDQEWVAEVIAAARAAQARQAPIALQASRDAGGIVVRVGAAPGSGTLWLVGFDPSHVTPVGRGENSGRTLTEVNVVRSIRAVGRWDGTALRLRMAPPAGQRGAVLLQAPDGRILAAAVLPAG